ncbi:MAG TPA: uracil-DNA glycosylase [Pyrinomonadaceae bacterium]|jgi:DNA polymerase|nr:uracil-DNA glycosylase [Pyrinomonadaceae bacterium]
MPSENQTAELLSLLTDTREQLNYLKELGVAGTEKQSPASAVSEKHARAEPASVAQFLSTAKPPRETGPSSLPSDTLFGDLSSPPVRIQKSAETFEEIWADVGDCTRCPLHQGRKNIVHTDGNRQARLMFVGEAPGADEDAQARPFVGRAGQLLTKIIEAIGFKREEVLIGNVNRCRPPANRPPTPEEVSMCKPFLLREIAAVQPEVIVVLGNTAMRNLLDIKQGITRVRGQFQDYHGVKVMPTFHPAYLLRDPSKKKETWEDLKKVRDYLELTRKPEK